MPHLSDFYNISKNTLLTVIKHPKEIALAGLALLCFNGCSDKPPGGVSIQYPHTIVGAAFISPDGQEMIRSSHVETVHTSPNDVPKHVNLNSYDSFDHEATANPPPGVDSEWGYAKTLSVYNSQGALFVFTALGDLDRDGGFEYRGNRPGGKKILPK